MTENVRVTCLLDRYWDPATMEYAGTEQTGTLIDVSMQSADEVTGKLVPTGIVLLDDSTFQSVPLEFLKKIPMN